jgi:hypothetical protein
VCVCVCVYVVGVGLSTKLVELSSVVDATVGDLMEGLEPVEVYPESAWELVQAVIPPAEIAVRLSDPAHSPSHRSQFRNFSCFPVFFWP